MKTENRRIICAIALLAVMSARPAFCDDLYVGNGDTDNTYSDTTAYAAATKIIKTGTGKTSLNLGDMTGSFNGEIEVREGTLAVKSTPNSFGAPTKITVSAGATLDLSWTDNKTGKIPDAEIVIEGNGVNNGGAIRRTTNSGINALFGTLTLSGDARIYTGQQLGFVASTGRVNLNGHTLTKDGSNKLYCLNTLFYGLDGTTDDPGNIVVANGTLFLHNGNALTGGSANNTITLQAGTSLQLRNVSSINWAINATGNDAKIFSDDTVSANNRNRLCGPISNTATLFISPGGTAPITLDGNSLTLEEGLTVNGSVPTTFSDVAISNKSVSGITIQHSSLLTHLVLAGNTVATSETNASGRAKTRFMMGSTEGRKGALEICDNTVVTNFGLAIGRDGIGALYQRGGHSCWMASDASYDRSGNSTGSYGYLGLTGGKFIFDGDGPVASDKSSHFGIAGSFVMATHGGSAEFKSSDKIGFAFKSGTVAYYQDGGTTNSFDGEFGFGYLQDANYAGHAYVTVAGAGTELLVKSYLRSLWSNAGSAMFLNVNNGGTVCANQIYRLNANSAQYINLNGGIIRTYGQTTSFSYNTEVKRYPTAATVYEGGMTFDTSRGGTTIHYPFVAPGGEGKRVASIALPAAAGFASEKIVAGSPFVTITGDGEGASAFALFDDTTCTVTNIVVTSPGWGYTTATATLSGAGMASSYTCAVTLEDQPAEGWKGFTKRGANSLQLNGANSFKGDVTVEGGTLLFKNGSAPQSGMPEGAGLTLKNGALISFSVASTPVTVPFIAGCGSTSHGNFTVTNRIECTAEDIFAARHLSIERNLTLADGVKIVVTDPENLVKYRNSGRAVVLEAGATSGTLTCAGDLELAFGAECPTEDIRRWGLRQKGKTLTLVYLRGAMILLR